MPDKPGQPTQYKEEYAEQARKLCMLGYTDAEIADFYNVTERTINNWKKKHPEFFQSLKDGKDLADGEVVAALYHRATGYSHKEDKILSNSQDPEKPVIVETTKHYPPDTTACAIWLNNRQSSRWKSRRPVDNVEEDDRQVDSVEYQVVDASKAETE